MSKKDTRAQTVWDTETFTPLWKYKCPCFTRRKMKEKLDVGWFSILSAWKKKWLIKKIFEKLHFEYGANRANSGLVLSPTQWPPWWLWLNTLQNSYMDYVQQQASTFCRPSRHLSCYRGKPITFHVPDRVLQCETRKAHGQNYWQFRIRRKKWTLPTEKCQNSVANVLNEVRLPIFQFSGSQIDSVD